MPKKFKPPKVGTVVFMERFPRRMKVEAVDKKKEQIRLVPVDASCLERIQSFNWVSFEEYQKAGYVKYGAPRRPI